MSWYTHLANSIVLQGVTDYRKALRGIKIHPTISPEVTKKECEDFFLSEWFSILTKVEGKRLMRELQEEFINEGGAYPKYKSPNRNNM